MIFGNNTQTISEQIDSFQFCVRRKLTKSDTLKHIYIQVVHSCVCLIAIILFVIELLSFAYLMHIKTDNLMFSKSIFFKKLPTRKWIKGEHRHESENTNTKGIIVYVHETINNNDCCLPLQKSYFNFLMIIVNCTAQFHSFTILKI